MNSKYIYFAIGAVAGGSVIGGCVLAVSIKMARGYRK